MAMGDNQTGKRRGRYKPRTAEAIESAPTDPASASARVERLTAEYSAAARARAQRSGATDLDLAGVASAAEQLARLVVHLERLSDLSSRGVLTVDESKTIPSVSREIRRVRAELGLSLYSEAGELTSGGSSTDLE